MKRILTTMAFLSPSAALAHPGEHARLSVGAFLTHLVSEPDHVALIVAALAVPVLVARRFRARK